VTNHEFFSISAKDVQFQNLVAKTIKFNNSNKYDINPNKNKSQKDKHTGIHSMYNIRTDSDLRIGQAAIRRIPCACVSCLKQLSLPWTPGLLANLQPRYIQNQFCSKWNMFEGTNDWEVVTITLDLKHTEESMVELVSEVVMECTSKIMEDNVIVGMFGAMAYNKEDEEDMGYYLFQWLSAPFSWKGEYDELHPYKNEEIQEGDMVASVVYLHEVNRAKNWFVLSNEKGLVKMQYTVSADVKLKIHSEENCLPPNYPRKTK
jgi:hypothetical protein